MINAKATARSNKLNRKHGKMGEGVSKTNWLQLMHLKQQ